jgi:hypothetical protein
MVIIEPVALLLINVEFVPSDFVKLKNASPPNVKFSAR